MSEYVSIVMPQINPNEIEAIVTSIQVSDGQQVKKGDLIATVESTKATTDLQAEADGYIIGLRISKGQKISVGEIICHIAREKNITIKDINEPEKKKTSERLPRDLRITQPAIEFARQHKIDIESLAKDQLITLERIMILHGKPSAITLPGKLNDTSLIIYGGGGHGKSLIELIRAEGKHSIAGIVDDGQIAGGELLGIKWLGGQETLEPIYKQGVHQAVNAVGGISSIKLRIDVFERLKKVGFAFPAVVHPSAVLEKSCNIIAGAQIFPLAYIGSSVKVGFGCIVNTGAILSHDCEIGDYVNISPGAILAGSVQVGRATLIGMGVTINLDVQIGANVRIGNSATVKADVPDGTVVHAGTIWPV